MPCVCQKARRNGKGTMGQSVQLRTLIGRDASMLLGSFTAYFAHGLLVVGAPESVDPHNDWDPALQDIHAVSDSIFVGVVDAAGGPLSVTCLEDSNVNTD